MPRRRPLTWSAIPDQLRLVIDAQQRLASKPLKSFQQPARTPMEQYQTTVTTSIPNAYAQAVVGAGGTASCQVGPAGVGTVWYPVSAAIATTSGAADGSTCTLYFGPLGLLSLVIGQSYAGGGDSLGLGVPAMSPGYFIVAIWTGAKAGDVATLNVIGTQDVLSP